MKKRIDRLIAALLALALGLAGCGKDARKEPENPVFPTSLYYTMEDIPTAAETGMLTGCCTDRESIWYLSEPEEEAEMVLCRVWIDGSATEILPEYQAPVLDGTPTSGCWGPVLGGDGKLWVWERFPVPQGDSKNTYRIRQLDPDSGKELSAVDITGVMSGMDRTYTSGFAVDASGTIFLADKLRIVAIDGQGQVLSTLKTRMPETLASDNAGGLLALLPDGTIGALVADSGRGRKVRTIDPETRDWTGTEYYVRDNVNQIYSGSGECIFYYISTECVYGAVAGEEVPVRFLPWENAMLDHPGFVRCFVLQEDGQAVIFSDVRESSMGSYDDLLQVTRLLPSDEEPEDAPVRVVYGTIGVDRLIKERISNFNGKNKDYRIVIRDYSEGMVTAAEKNPQVYQSALSRFYADLTTGKGPDIIDSSIPLDGLARQDAMEDLWTWIESDPEINREDLMDHVLECMEIDGKLPKVCSSFIVNTAVASMDVAGGRAGWTMEEMLDAFGGEMPEFYFGCLNDLSGLIEPVFNRINKRAILYYMVNMSLDRFIDWETGECFFDGEDFKTVLQLISTMKEVENTGNLDDVYFLVDSGIGLIDDMDWSLLDAVEPVQVLPWEGKPLLYMRSLSQPYQLVVDDVAFGGREALVDGYVQRLWDAGILYESKEPDLRGNAVYLPLYSNDISQWDWFFNGYTDVYNMRYDTDLAVDVATGSADGGVYAAYVGVPTASGTGSSFSVLDCMGISAASTRKEEAWGFVRTLLLPDGYGVDISGEPSYVPIHTEGFSMYRATFEAELEQKYWTDPRSGEVFTDADGQPVEFTPHGVGVGYPGDMVLMAYTFAPTEAQIERFWNLYNAIDHITGSDDELLDIILEQADAYFAGDESVEDTARLIQNRAKLYVNERR